MLIRRIILFSILTISIPFICLAAETFFESGWGDDAAQIGLIDREEAERIGPITFCLSGDAALIMDTAKQRVVKVQAGKELSVAAENAIGWSICPDAANGFYLYDGKKLNHFSKGVLAESTSKFSAKKIIEGYGSELSVSEANGVILNNVNQKGYTLSAGEVKALNGKAGSADSGLRFSIKRISSKDIRILGKDSDGKILVTVPIQIESSFAGAVLFKGQDDTGNLFVELEKLVGGKAELQVHKYGLDGKKLNVYNLPNDYYTTVYKKTEIAPDGSVYQLLTTQDGVKIIRY